MFATSEPGTGLLRIPASGGEPEVLTVPDVAAGEFGHQWPEFLLGGETVLFDIVSTGNTQVAALALETGEWNILIPGGANARYVSAGYIVFASDGTLRAVRFDPERLELLGASFTVLDEEVQKPFLSQEGATVREARFSPDQRFVAYRSNESGRDEIYVVPFPGPGGKWQISTDGGGQAMWGPEGSELFYKSGDRMMVVSVSTDPSFEPSTPRVLFETALPESTPGDPDRYAVSADHQRFLITAPAPGADESAGPEMHVIMNWFEELERLTPAGN